VPREGRCSHFFQLIVDSRLLGKFSERVRRVDSLEDADLEMVLKIVFVRVGADIELIGNKLAVDFVEQRVKFVRRHG
jgi:hypothetical protein